MKPNGSFLEQICLLHSGWGYFDGADIPPGFVAVGDTLEIWIDCAKNEAPLSGRGFKIQKNIYAVFAQIACHCGAAAPTFRGSGAATAMLFALKFAQEFFLILNTLAARIVELLK